MTTVQWAYLVVILACAFAGGFVPFARPAQARSENGFPNGEAFSAGVFLALSLTMLMPSAFAGFRQALPESDYPMASVVAIVAFLVLLAIEHLSDRLAAQSLAPTQGTHIPAIIPIAMTGLIAGPSFLLGAALGISDPAAAALIFVAIILHKGTAAFALALAMTRSTLTRPQALSLFTCFALTTPLGILVGGLASDYLTGSALLVKATVLALGAGVFLYLGTLHELSGPPLIRHCCKLRCFLFMLAGLSITAFVRWMVGEAHRF